MAELDDRFSELLERMWIDDNVLAFWLDGSRGKDQATADSDYDCTMIVRDAVWRDYHARHASAGRSGIDLTVLTLGQFRSEAAWGSPDAWKRYNFAHLTPLIDRTGSIQMLFDEKAHVPPPVIDSFIRAAVDHVINQVFRALKCLRDGDAPAARLEAAEVTAPLLDALFALNGGRLRPYYKYLTWELTMHTLEHRPWGAEELVTKLVEFASRPDSTQTRSSPRNLSGHCVRMGSAKYSTSGVMPCLGSLAPLQRCLGFLRRHRDDSRGHGPA
jgi:hypothetical protein